MESQFLSPVGVPPHLRSEGIYRVHTSVYIKVTALPLQVFFYILYFIALIYVVFIVTCLKMLLPPLNVGIVF